MLLTNQPLMRVSELEAENYPPEDFLSLCNSRRCTILTDIPKGRCVVGCVVQAGEVFGGFVVGDVLILDTCAEAFRHGGEYRMTVTAWAYGDGFAELFVDMQCS